MVVEHSLSPYDVLAQMKPVRYHGIPLHLGMKGRHACHLQKLLRLIRGQAETERKLEHCIAGGVANSREQPMPE